MIAVDLSKQQASDADPRAIEPMSFTANLDRAGTTRIFYSGRCKRNYFGLFTRNCKSIVNMLKNNLNFSLI